MKKTTFLAALLTALIMMITPQMAFAEEFSNSDAKCSFDGNEISSNFDSSDLATFMSNLEPGDSLEYKVTYVNASGKTTEWYMLNDVLETLEENKNVAENGGYSYMLKNVGPDGTETVYFDNTKVGGDDSPAGLEGLKQATNATKNYFFIQQLAPGQSGTTVLRVELDGETQVNDYMDTKAVIRLAYAAEIITPAKGNDKKSDPENSTTKTGDPFDLIPGLLLMTAALIIGMLAFIAWRRERKDGDQA